VIVVPINKKRVFVGRLLWVGAILAALVAAPLYRDEEDDAQAAAAVS
jgi:hypothetical protein